MKNLNISIIIGKSLLLLRFELFLLMSNRLAFVIDRFSFLIDNFLNNFNWRWLEVNFKSSYPLWLKGDAHVISHVLGSFAVGQLAAIIESPPLEPFGLSG